MLRLRLQLQLRNGAIRRTDSLPLVLQDSHHRRFLGTDRRHHRAMVMLRVTLRLTHTLRLWLWLWLTLTRRVQAQGLQGLGYMTSGLVDRTTRRAEAQSQILVFGQPRHGFRVMMRSHAGLIIRH